MEQCTIERHRYNVKTKKQFMEYIQYFEDPYLEEGSEHGGLINRWFIVNDRKDWLNKKLILRGCKLYSGFSNEDLDNYDRKEEKLRVKYNKWLEEAKRVRDGNTE